ncbi:MAG: DUF2332 family protein [Pseudomonadota bacterium]
MTPALTDAFTRQAEACEALGSPFMGRVLRMLLDAVPPGPIAALLTGWREDRLGAAHDSLPLRLAAALHQLVLAGDHPLSAVYPPHTPGDDALRAALTAALSRDADAILAAMESPPQTNEVRRASVLIAAGHWLTARFGRPLVVSEVGASAGLNLNWDFFCLETPHGSLGPVGSPLKLTPEWRGVVPVICPPYVAEAAGVDLRPIDIRDAGQALRLRSYLWPDQPHRKALTDAAIALFLSPDTEAQVSAGDALDWLPTRLAGRAGHCHMIYSTVAWQYLPFEAQERGAAMIAEAGARATTDAPLAWVRMESDGQMSGAAVTLDLWPGGSHISLGRADFHGRWVDWAAPAP